MNEGYRSTAVFYYFPRIFMLKIHAKIKKMWEMLTYCQVSCKRDL